MSGDRQRQPGIRNPNTTLIAQQPQKCANCDIEFQWSPTIVQGRAYCCTGCASGGPCCCDYSQYSAVNISGVIHYGPGTGTPQKTTDS